MTLTTRSPSRGNDSLASSIASSPHRAKILESLSPQETAALEYAWQVWARPKQLRPEGDWLTWLILAGRGFGKTRTGAETVRQWVEDDGRRSSLRIHLVGATAGDVRDTMIEGESGLLSISPSWNRPRYYPSKRRVVWKSGAQAVCFSADEPDRMRGPQCHKAWGDELAAWRYPEAWDQLQFGLRLGTQPQVVVTTTPRPTRLVRNILADGRTFVTTGTTYENKANLARSFLQQIVAKYEGTRLGRQELLAELLDDNPGALWRRDRIDELRVRHKVAADGTLTLPRPELGRIVVAVDPAVTNHEEDDPGDGKKRKRRRSNETGILVVGLGKTDHHGYVLEDISGRYSPNDWAQKVVKAYDTWSADAVVAEVNQGGDLVVANIKNVRNTVRVKQVRATRGKHVRAEPVAALYEQGRVHHVGTFPMLEDQMCTWDPSLEDEDSPDRVDALVWGLTELVVRPGLGEDTRAGVVRSRSNLESTPIY